MQQSADNSIDQYGGASELSTDSPSRDSKPTNFLNTSEKRVSKKIFSITKVMRNTKTAKLKKIGFTVSKDRSANVLLLENGKLVNRLFGIKQKYKSTLISMKVVL